MNTAAINVNLYQLTCRPMDGGFIMARVLGLSASLRGARHGNGVSHLCSEIEQLSSKSDLDQFISEEAKILHEEYMTVGLNEGKPFDEVYKNLKKSLGKNGLCNSEAALVAGLWGAHQNKAEIDYASLQVFFPASGNYKNLDLLKHQILQADAILLSGPVYFGDRSSIAQEFIDFMYSDKEIRNHIKNKIYAGIAVGAKRNGGQETTLVYQLIDMTNLNMLAVGNGEGTTAQYGGTVVAGDVGSVSSDTYGLDTAIGAGKRIAHVSSLMQKGAQNDSNEPVKIAVVILQDNSQKNGKTLVNDFCGKITKESDNVEFHILDFSSEYAMRCIACDICPIASGVPNEYRCIIKSKKDLFVKYHEQLIDYDAILVSAYSPCDRHDITSVYQRFVERTRYLRRDNYAIGDLLVAPLIFSELNSNQNLHIRIATSMIRHNSIMHHPLIGIFRDNKVIDWSHIIEQGLIFVDNVRHLSSAKTIMGNSYRKDWKYNPIGYVISKNKRRFDDNIAK